MSLAVFIFCYSMNLLPWDQGRNEVIKVTRTISQHLNNLFFEVLEQSIFQFFTCTFVVCFASFCCVRILSVGQWPSGKGRSPILSVETEEGMFVQKPFIVHMDCELY